MLTCGARTTSNDSPETLPVPPCFQGLLCCSPQLWSLPYTPTRCKSSSEALFVCLFLNRKPPKFSDCFLIGTFLFSTGEKQNPPTQVIATQSCPGLEFPAGFSSSRAERKDFPWELQTIPPLCGGCMCTLRDHKSELP